MIIDIIKDWGAPKKALQIFEISDEKERNRQIALWACEFGFDELRYMPLPTPPVVVENYFKIDIQQRKKMNKDPENYLSFWRNPQVKKYFDDCEKISNLNKSNLLWLNQLLEWLEDNLAEREKVQLRIYEFE